ncbi:MAG: sulfatase-like hydrolase/transferase [Polyangiaceae bacterium]|nr:sulfatase-like hydrolase/transferase [Polyangiaceae bacterium]
MQVQAVIAELSRARANGQTYVTWAHFYEPHHPYAVHTGYDFGRSEERDRYASEIAYLDAELGRLFSFLEESGAYRDTLVIVFSDHGEALGERGYHGHHVYLDGFMTDVPLAVRAPGVAPREVRGVVELTDVAATIAHFVGVPEAAGSAGSSLLAGDPPADRVAISEAFPIRGRDLFAIANTPVRSFAELEARMALVHAGAKRYSPKVAIATADYRLIVDRETGVRELYRRGDPLVEPENVARSEPRALTTLVDRLDRWHRETAHAIYCTVRDAADPASMPAATVP